MIGLWRKGFRRLVTKGPGDTLRWVFQWVKFQLYDRYREWSLGIESASFEEWKRSLGDPRLHPYQPLSYVLIETALASLEIRPGQDVFLDYGSGKGRVVTVAATYPFKSVIGVELVPELNRIAEQNIRRARGKLKCQMIEFVTADATRFPVPSDVTVVFLYNPFFGEVVSAVLEQIYLSYLACPRPITIIYMNPLVEENRIDDCQWLMKTRSLKCGLWEHMRFLVYEPVGIASDTRAFSDRLSPGGRRA